MQQKNLLFWKLQWNLQIFFSKIQTTTSSHHNRDHFRLEKAAFPLQLPEMQPKSAKKLAPKWGNSAEHTAPPPLPQTNPK